MSEGEKQLFNSDRAHSTPQEQFEGANPDRVPPPGLTEKEQGLWRIIQEDGMLPKSVKFKKGWIKELKNLKGSFPQKDQELLQKESVLGEESIILQKDLEDTLGWRVPIKEVTRDTTSQVVKADTRQLERSGDELLGITKYLGQDSAKWISKRDLKDLSMTTSTEGWVKYWLDRLKPELEILPAPIAKIVQEGNSAKKLGAKMNGLQSYVGKRTSALREELKRRAFAVAKQERITILRFQVQAIRSGKDPFESHKQQRTPVYFNERTHSFVIREQKEIKQISLGDMLADYSWGLRYTIDPSVPEQQRKVLLKHLAINEARRDIEEIYDGELITFHHISAGTGSIPMDHLERMYAHGKINRSNAGILAERAAREFLTRVAINNPETGIVVERSNAMEDTELKYDFKIRRKQKLRGIALAGIDMPREEYIKEKRRLGIQFTISARPAVLQYKVEQLTEARKKILNTTPFIKKNVDDISLVAIDFHSIGDYFQRWVKEGKPPGGPEQYMTAEEKKELLRAAIKNFAPISEEMLNKMAGIDPAPPDTLPVIE
ncbi:MAG: hypothetical protein A3I44_02640 [Candidatus Sungbacteria bacterium RIFCSPLOWO2_02_FULL_51_17]|uniref:Uncharacterized protein n=1 Tax=Candidatus Sungbacteria bacterium RIFCSPHIGHO2_02_FULL_51_29 TaxID=1802273 RepID=A0A1G2KVT9_9BACT|nr:MAG: hypothetical protein A2676_02275 [Candidatus Sungbacteria bacterium RIFCSPHIGHO2_01_FULL_51_22]OHA03555.1 MAG: hypothetical protein A3C16_04695 [Candidatus Sungbacteria bacterium RIFCSPHIGHO2_02_FULL_51_29]OHA10798.1 MAG: hypothetical protein A3I44_02640 [Candidatus Sungbacteria bacterium RIFCSPLOWO2_02_FULL_51_17]